MKKIVLVAVICIFGIYPPNGSKEGSMPQTVDETELNYLLIKNAVLKYQLDKAINQFYKEIKK